MRRTDICDTRRRAREASVERDQAHGRDSIRIESHSGIPTLGRGAPNSQCRSESAFRPVLECGGDGLTTIGSLHTLRFGTMATTMRQCALALGEAQSRGAPAALRGRGLTRPWGVHTDTRNIPSQRSGWKDMRGQEERLTQRRDGWGLGWQLGELSGSPTTMQQWVRTSPPTSPTTRRVLQVMPPCVSAGGALRSETDLLTDRVRGFAGAPLCCLSKSIGLWRRTRCFA